MPKRIQRKRTKGWKMPPNTVYVGRPTKWGNPYKASEGYRQADAVDCYRRHLVYIGMTNPEWYEELLAPLRGKDLACWCREDEPCHADVLLKLANSEQGA